MRFEKIFNLINLATKVPFGSSLTNQIVSTSALTNPIGSRRQLSDFKSYDAIKLESKNLNAEIKLLGSDYEVKFYELVEVKPEVAIGYSKTQIAFLPDPFLIGKYSVSALHRKAFRKIRKEMPTLDNANTMWKTRVKSEFEINLRQAIQNLLPYVDLSIVSVMSFIPQFFYFAFMRPLFVMSNADSIPSIKVLTDNTIRIESKDEHGTTFLLIERSKEDVALIPPNCLALKLIPKSE